MLIRKIDKNLFYITHFNLFEFKFFFSFFLTPGLFLEGARWDFEKTVLAESQPKILFARAPTMLFKPYRTADLPAYPHYKCPVYKTSDRR